MFSRILRHTTTAVATALLYTLPAQAAESGAVSIDRALQGEHRSAANKARDAYRHPRQTLEFFGLEPQMKVVELWPGGGWYTEILAPVLRDGGTLYAAGYDPDAADTNDFRRKLLREFTAKLDARPEIYGKVIRTHVSSDGSIPQVADGSVDRVLTFRNVHNWLQGGYADQVFAAAYRVLAPGGVLGVVEHRAPDDWPVERMAETGYVSERQVIALAERAGFRLADRSEINANPKDTKDHPKGVWTLPPSLRLGEQDRDKYLAIGESDRMTLKFVKPAP